MMKLLLMLLGSALFLNGGYTYSITDIDGNEIQMSSFTGKKVLIVNTASESDSAAQFAGLEALHNLYNDSLVIIAFPSNSFNNEPLDSAAIQSFISSNYNAHYVIASKTIVTGADQHPLFRWLTNDGLNHAVSTDIQYDFYKFLLDENGELMGVFSNEVPPMDSSIIKAIGLPAVMVQEEQ